TERRCGPLPGVPWRQPGLSARTGTGVPGEAAPWWHTTPPAAHQAVDYIHMKRAVRARHAAGNPADDRPDAIAVRSPGLGQSADPDSDGDCPRDRQPGLSRDP